MHWIKSARCNQGKAGSLQMNINDFKKFVNTTFKMDFMINNNKNDDNASEKNKNENNNENHQNDSQKESKEDENKNNNKNSNSNQNKHNPKSKFHGQYNHNFGNTNNKNKKSKQSTIMESMGARLREMVSDANANDIHHPVTRPIFNLPNLPNHKMILYYSDNYGFSTRFFSFLEKCNYHSDSKLRN